MNTFRNIDTVVLLMYFLTLSYEIITHTHTHKNIFCFLCEYLPRGLSYLSNNFIILI